MKAHNRIIIKCLYCNKNIEVPPFKLKIGRGKFCSKHCASRARTGKSAAHWKGGKGSERHAAMAKLEYKQWRYEVFKRDNFTCQLCSEKGGKLNADHIKPWSKFPDLRYDLNNGRTLCAQCHRGVTRHAFGKC